MRGSAYIARLERTGARIEQADSLIINIAKLRSGRIDILATSADLSNETAPLVELLKMHVGDSYIACHPALEETL